VADSLDQIKADLRTLPCLKKEVEKVYLNGGWNLKGKPPSEYDQHLRARWKERNGRGYDEEPPPIEVSSVESTLHLIRQMREAKWSKIETLTMMSRPLAKGTAYLLWFRDFDEEFERCWQKAGRPVASFRADKPKSKKDFVSNRTDRDRVLTMIELRADAGLQTHQRTLRDMGEDLLGGKYWVTRVVKALKALEAEGLITSDPQGRGKYTFYSPAPLALVEAEWVDDGGPDPYDTDRLFDWEIPDLSSSDASVPRVVHDAYGRVGKRDRQTEDITAPSLWDSDLEGLFSDA
jgi:hypothetical protein